MRLKSLISSLAIASCLPFAAFAANSSAPVTDLESNHTCIPGQPETSNNYNATKWYRSSAERNAQYNQVFNIGLEKIATTVKQDKLKKHNWGVIMDIDETVLDNSQYEKGNVLSCSSYSPQSNYAFMEQKTSIATPGAKNFTCSVQKMGGRVVFVTNRDGHFDDKIQAATVDNLKSAGLCYDNVIFANGSKDSDKTPRFNAVIAGDYSNIIAIDKIKPIKVVAYFGDNIQDFPNIKQSDAIKQDPNDISYYSKFGQEYFSLPNPTYGSWEHNSFK